MILETSSLRIQVSDVKLLRFLRGRNGVIDECYKSLVKHFEWRERHNVDSLTEQSCLNEVRKSKAIIHGFCRQGRPVMYVFADRHDSTDRDIHEMFRYIVWTLEELVKKAKPEEEKITMVFDLSQFTMRCMDFEVVRTLASVVQLQFPEVLSVGLILRAPWVFSASWTVIKGILDPVTAKKVEFVSFQEIQSFIDVDSMPDDLRVRNGLLALTASPSTPSSSSTRRSPERS